MKNGIWVPDTVHMGYGVLQSGTTYVDSYESRVDQMLRVAGARRFGVTIEHLDVRGAGTVKLFLLALPEIGNPMPVATPAGGYRPTGLGTQVNPANGFPVANRRVNQVDLIDGVLYYSTDGVSRTALSGVALQTYLGWRVEYTNTSAADAWSYAWRAWYYME